MKRTNSTATFVSTVIIVVGLVGVAFIAGFVAPNASGPPASDDTAGVALVDAATTQQGQDDDFTPKSERVKGTRLDFIAHPGDCNADRQSYQLRYRSDRGGYGNLIREIQLNDSNKARIPTDNVADNEDILVTAIDESENVRKTVNVNATGEQQPSDCFGRDGSENYVTIVPPETATPTSTPEPTPTSTSTPTPSPTSTATPTETNSSDNDSETSTPTPTPFPGPTPAPTTTSTPTPTPTSESASQPADGADEPTPTPTQSPDWSNISVDNESTPAAASPSTATTTDTSTPSNGGADVQESNSEESSEQGESPEEDTTPVDAFLNASPLVHTMTIGMVVGLLSLVFGAYRVLT